MILNLRRLKIMDFNSEIQAARGQRIKNCKNVFMQDLFFPLDVKEQLDKIIGTFEVENKNISYDILIGGINNGNNETD